MWNNTIKQVYPRDALPFGSYVWEVFSLETQIFENYTVANDEKAYPEFGEQNGKLYKRLDVNFEDASWAKIAEYAHSGYAKAFFNYGDEKDIELSSGEKITMVVADFDHDIYEDGSTSPLTLIMKNCLNEAATMNATSANAGGWEQSVMRNTTLPNLLNQFPAEVREIVKGVRKKSTGGNKSTALITTTDFLWLLCEEEMFGAITYSVAGEGTVYPIYTDNISRLKTVNGGVNGWWGRSCRIAGTSGFARCGSDGGATYGSSSAYGVSFGFCV